ncbi:MAG: hypothetical protein KDB22_07915 [Planctomycetales bacterium]|nr:hypothetical protein [Planctomycetales bacterium]
MSETSFGFQWTTLSLLISVLAVAGVCALSWYTWRRSGFRRSVFFLELLRIAIVGFAVFLLNQPETVQEFKPAEQPTVVILGDQSRSMTTQDVGLGSESSAGLLTRQQAIESLLDEETWNDISEHMEVVISGFGADDSGSRSNLYEAIDKARTEHENLRAVVLASDGDWNDGLPPVQAAMRLRLERIPIFAVPVGSETRLPDLDLISFDVPTFGIVGKTVRIPFTIESSLPRDHVAQVEMKVSDGTSIKHQIRVAAMGRTSDAILWKPENVADYTLTLTVPTHPEERIKDNNFRETPIAIREEKLKVLVVESLPRWEYRYLRNALSRDPGVELHCLLFHPGLEKVGGGNRDYIQEFPEGLEELSQYDVVFLGDVGLNDKQLTEEQCRLLKGLVEQQASGLVFMPGMKGNLLSLNESPLSTLIPVVFDPAQPMGWGSRTPSHFALTELGRRSLLTKLADTQDENMQVWESLPGFQWHAPVIRAKAGADVLAVHQESSNEYGRIPLLVTRTFGAGKVLFMGTDAAWRWRRGVEDIYHYRFWGQVVRWMAYRRNMAEGELMRFYYSPELPQIRQTIAVSANVMEKNGEPLSKGLVTARFVAPSGRTETVAMASSGSEWGAFAGVFTPAEPGTYQVILRCKENGSELTTSLFVQGATLEQVGKPARFEVMQELSRVTEGRVANVADLSQLIKDIQDVPEPPNEIRRVQLWSHPLSAATLILLLGLFWVGRKVIGLI